MIITKMHGMYVKKKEKRQKMQVTLNNCKYLEKNMSNATLSTTKPIWTPLRLNLLTLDSEASNFAPELCHNNNTRVSRGIPISDLSVSLLRFRTWS